MARQNQNPRKAAMRKLMRNFLKENDISVKDGEDINSLMRDMMSALIEGTLDGELDDTLGYDRYDYENKETDNSRNGHSKKTMHTSYGDMEVDIPCDRKGEYTPQLQRSLPWKIWKNLRRNGIQSIRKSRNRGRSTGLRCRLISNIRKRSERSSIQVIPIKKLCQYFLGILINK